MQRKNRKRGEQANAKQTKLKAARNGERREIVIGERGGATSAFTA